MIHRIYLASPYSSGLTKDARGQAVQLGKRYNKAIHAAAWLASHTDCAVYSPIVSWHVVASKHKLPRGYNFWERQDDSMIDWCTRLYVLTLPGWLESHGVSREIVKARNAGKELYRMSRRTKNYVQQNRQPLYVMEQIV